MSAEMHGSGVREPRCADIEGASLHGAVGVKAGPVRRTVATQDARRVEVKGRSKQRRLSGYSIAGIAGSSWRTHAFSHPATKQPVVSDWKWPTAGTHRSQLSGGQVAILTLPMSNAKDGARRQRLTKAFIAPSFTHTVRHLAIGSAAPGAAPRSAQAVQRPTDTALVDWHCLQ